MMDRIYGSIFCGLFGATFIGLFFGNLIAAAIGFVASVISYNNFVREDVRAIKALREESDRLTACAAPRNRSRGRSQPQHF